VFGVSTKRERATGYKMVRRTEHALLLLQIVQVERFARDLFGDGRHSCSGAGGGGDRVCVCV
jgi:hypothetical protein